MYIIIRLPCIIKDDADFSQGIERLKIKKIIKTFRISKKVDIVLEILDIQKSEIVTMRNREIY